MLIRGPKMLENRNFSLLLQLFLLRQKSDNGIRCLFHSKEQLTELSDLYDQRQSCNKSKKFLVWAA